VATLADLHRELFPAAIPAAPLEAAEAGRIVSWVRVLKARVPALDALDPSDLVIVPATALALVAPGRPEMAALADGLLRAHAAGVLVVGGDAPGTGTAAGTGTALAGDLVAPLGDAFVALGIPTFVLGGGEAAALERSIIGYLVNRRAELEHQASLLEAQLERLALGASDLPALVAAIGQFLGRAVALEGRRGDALAIQAPASALDAAAATAAYLARSRAARLRASALRVALPAAAKGTTSPGALVLLGDREPTELERVVAERIAGLLALEIARTESVRAARDAARRSEALPAAGPPWVVLVARQVLPGDALGIDDREEIRRELRRLAPARRMGLRGDASSLELRAVLVADGDDARGLELGGRIAGFLGRGVSVSRPFLAAEDRPAAEAEARATLDAAETLREPPSVARADRLPVYRLLGNLHNLPDGTRQARALLEPLLGGSPAVVRDRLATLRALLEQPGLAEAAAALGVHRNTIAYRARRIEALTGWRLEDPELRFPLTLALRLVHEEQSEPP
jgi:hypothetical protein